MEDEVAAGSCAVVGKEALMTGGPNRAVDEGCNHEEAAEYEDGDGEYAKRPWDKVELWVSIDLCADWFCGKEYGSRSRVGYIDGQ